MKLKLVYDKKEDVPEAHLELFTEKDGKFHFTGVEGMKTQTDVDNVQKALVTERTNHAATKAKAKAWDDLGIPVEEVQAKLDRVDELEASSSGKVDETKIEEMVERRVATRLAPLQREKQKLEATNKEQATKIDELENTRKRGVIETAVRSAAQDAKIVGHAIDDVVMLGERQFEIGQDGRVVTRDGVGTTPGLDVKSWLEDLKDRKAHWWPVSQGGGAGGTGGPKIVVEKNPWSADHWNLTEQGTFLRANGMEKATALAKQAGTTVGGLKPGAKKTAA